VKLHIKIKGLVDLMPQIGVGATERKNHPDLDGLCLSHSAHAENYGGCSKPPGYTHVVPP
jgi:hypothetical protein